MLNFDNKDIMVYKELLERKDNIQLDIYRSYTGFSLYSIDSNYITELEMSIIPNRQMILNRIVLKNRRIGTMTELFKISIDLCKKYSIHKFIVQSVITKEMSRWCIKNGLSPCEYSGYYVNDVFIGDYSIDV